MSLNMNAVAQPVLDAALADTKAWLRIETSLDDAGLADQVAAAVGMAEDFCAQVLFARVGVETLTARCDWTRLRAAPVRAITAARALADDGTTAALPADAWSADIGADGDAWVRVREAGGAKRVEADISAGLADDWAGLPDALSQGIVRLAAHLFVEREASAPPAIVTALWRPWRRMRIA